MPAIPVHHTATTDESWDGPAAVAAMPNDASILHYCHAWESADAGDEKSGYKFPHARTKGGPANLAACRNGLARLSGADIPDGDRAGVKAHLQAHLDDAAKKSGDNTMTRSSLRMARPAAQLVQGKRDWYRIENKASASGPADIYVYDEIGFFGVMASDFLNDIAAIKAQSINLHINSPGGDVFDGIAIMQALKDHPATVTTYVDSIAASIASVIAMAGDTVIMKPNATMMIHDGFSVCIGNAADMRKQADLLDKCSNNIASIYQAKAGGTVADWRAAMETETWYTADEAVAAGLADKIDGKDDTADEDIDIAAKWDLSIFARVPRSIMNADGKPYKPQPYHKDADESVTCPECGKANDDDASYCDQCGAKLVGRDDVTVSDKAQPDEDAGSPNKTPSKEDEEDEPNPSKKRVPTSARLDWDKVAAQFDPEIFRSAIADIGKL